MPKAVLLEDPEGCLWLMPYSGLPGQGTVWEWAADVNWCLTALREWRKP